MEKLGICHGHHQRFVILYKDGTHFAKPESFTESFNWVESTREPWTNKVASKELVEWLD